MNKLIQLKQKDLLPLRKKQWEKQNKKCPILDKKIPFEKSCMDHKHITKKEIKEGKVGEDGKGLLRGVLHNQCNAWEGKVSNSFKRTGLHKLGVYLPDALRRLAKYLEKPLIKQKYIHPKEKEDPETFGKRDYNKVKKYYFKIYPNRRKIPEFPKSGIKEDKNGKKTYKAKLTKDWQELIDKANKIHKEK